MSALVEQETLRFRDTWLTPALAALSNSPFCTSLAAKHVGGVGWGGWGDVNAPCTMHDQLCDVRIYLCMRYPAMRRLFYDLSVDPQNPAANAGVTLFLVAWICNRKGHLHVGKDDCKGAPFPGSKVRFSFHPRSLTPRP